MIIFIVKTIGKEEKKKKGEGVSLT